jgi:hypothetical protein
MSDAESIPTLTNIASDRDQLIAAQHVAAKRLLDFDGEIYPADGCAITLSVLLQEAGIAVPDTYQAITLGNLLKSKRNWQPVAVGEQKAGDVGSTCGSKPNHGYDHIYVVLKVLNSDEMVIADNQQQAPHFRFASGKGGKTPTKFFLRASE